MKNRQGGLQNYGKKSKGSFSYGYRNYRGEMLVNLFWSQGLFLMNSFRRGPKGRIIYYLTILISIRIVI